jgi:signal transduction histidine kinase
VPDLSALRYRLGDRLRPSPPLVVDVAVAAVCYLATVTVPVKDATAQWWLFVLAAVASVPLVWRRRWPIVVTAIVGAGTIGLAATGGLNDVPLPYGQLVATYTFASLSPPGWRLLGVAGTVAGIVWSVLMLGQRPSLIAVTGLPFAGAYALGTGARARRDRITMLEERTRRLAEAHEAAAARERERIAREMHDVLAHSVSLIVVQAEAGPVVVRTDPGRAEAAFDAIAATGRDALRQLRRTLGVLRSDGPERQPQPSLNDVPALLDQARRAGLAASLAEHGARRPLPAELEIAVYRIVQESVTNTVKHAAAGWVRVRLEWRDTALRVEVTDDGCGAGPVDGPTGGTVDGTVGHGLVGMRERVAACGGQLRTGAGDGGSGFRVTATLPLGARPERIERGHG